MCGAFVWACRALNGLQRRFPARAVLQVAGVVTLSLVINGSIIGVIYNRMNVYPENTHTVRAALGRLSR